MSKLKVLVAVLAVVALLLLPTAAFAMRVPPAVFMGTAHLDEVVVAGASVTAEIDGVERAVAVTDAAGRFYLEVVGNFPGETVIFKVNEIAAVETGIWASGTTTVLDLHATTPPPEAIDEVGVTLTPTEGLITTISGVGFTPLSAINITWAGEPVTTIPPAVFADTLGKFTAAIVPPTITPGLYMIGAADEVDRSDEAPFVIPEVVGVGVPGPEGPEGPPGADGAPGADGEPGQPGGVVPAIIAIILAVIAIILVFVFKPKGAEAA